MLSEVVLTYIYMSSELNSKSSLIIISCTHPFTEKTRGYPLCISGGDISFPKLMHLWVVVNGHVIQTEFKSRRLSKLSDVLFDK